MSYWERRRHEAETFRAMVEERGQMLRGLTHDQLLLLADEPTVEVAVGKRKGEISVIVEPCDGDRVKVVVQGFISACSWLPSVKGVALHGFYKHRDGTITEMRNDEFYGYD